MLRRDTPRLLAMGHFLATCSRNAQGAAAVLILALVIGFGLSTSAAAQPLGTIYGFGDSSSDTGNLYDALILGGVPPALILGFTNGRLTNGLNWVDYLSDSLNRNVEASLRGGNNFAYASAYMGMGAAPVPGVPGGTVPNAGTQIAAYTGAGGTFSSDDLTFLYAGHNEALDVAGGAGPDPLVTAAEFAANLTSLYNSGARRIIVPTLVAVEFSPDVVALGQTAQVAAWIEAFEAQKRADIAAFQALHPDVDIIIPDMHALIADIIARPAEYGFSNTDQVAYDPGTGAVVSDADSYLWWDVHVTTAAQRLMAQTTLGALGAFYTPKEMVPQAAAATLQINRIMAREAMKRTARRMRGNREQNGKDGKSQVFVTPYYAWGRQGGTGDTAAGYSWSATGLDTGFHSPKGDFLRLGIVVDGGHADSDIDSGLGDAQTNCFGFQPFMSLSDSLMYFNGGVRLSKASSQASRTFSFNGDTPKAGFSNMTLGTWFETGMEKRLSANTSLIPLLGMNWTNVEGSKTDESSGSLADSTIDLRDYVSLQHVLGLQFNAMNTWDQTNEVNLKLLAEWEHEYRHTRTQSSSTLAATERSLTGPDSGRDFFTAGFQLAFNFSSSAQVEFTYDGKISENTTAHSTALQMEMTF